MSTERASGAGDEVAALIERLRAEARASGVPDQGLAAGQGSGRSAPGGRPRSCGRSRSDRAFVSKPGGWGRLRGTLLTPLKFVLKKLMRWYVEPPFSDQRTFNAAALRLVDETHAQTSATIAQLEERLARLERGRSPDSDSAMRIAVCLPQVPFAHGGAEVLAESLVDELRRRDHTVDLVTVPFKWYPGAKVLSQALLWRLLDLEEVDGKPIDLVIATKFPSYVVRHPNKVVWLVHQFRQAYDLHGTELAQFADDPVGREIRRSVERLDRTTLGEARGLFAISRTLPTACANRRTSGGGAPPTSSRAGLPLRRVRRLRPLRRAARPRQARRSPARGCGGWETALHVVVAGDGPDRDRLEHIAGELGLDGRVQFAGRVGDAELADLYARCLAVYYAPIDEDHGFVPYEAFPVREAGRHDARCGRAAGDRRRRRERAGLRADS